MADTQTIVYIKNDGFDTILYIISVIFMNLYTSLT